ncbi:MAG: transposase [Gammaproteobacteria bacterium]|nr:MAG: transposase [Gammaproteobacteria bacterium]
MSNYRRDRVSGGTWFFTVAVADRKSDLLIREIDILRDAVRRVRHDWPFRIDAWVVLPDHLHTVWTLPADDHDFSTRWRLIKSHFSRALPRQEIVSRSRQRKAERGLWQRRFWEHRIRNDRDYRAHLDYVHYNPVKHGHVTRVADWPYSSFHRDVSRGLYPNDWGGGVDLDGRFGE